MKEDKVSIFLALEQSLISFLLQKRDLESKVSGGERRIRGIKFKIDTKNENNPYFVVQIGICEAAFNPVTGLKIKGSCYGIERYVRDWFERPSVKSEIKNYINFYLKRQKKEE